MVIKIILIFTSLFFLAGCSSKNNLETNAKNLEEKYLKEYNSNQQNTPFVDKWVQASNKNEACKVYIQTPKNSDRSLNENFNIFWDGECKDGYAFGLGREFEKDLLVNNESIVLYENAPFKKPIYYYQKSINDNIEIKGDFANGYKVFKIKKNNQDLIRYGLFSNNKDISLISYEKDNKEIYKKIYPNFDYEIIYDKSTNNYSFFLNSKNSRLSVNDSLKRRNIINEILNAKDKAIVASNKADTIINQYKNKICKDYINVNFMDDYDYKSICPENKPINEYISNENIKDELNFLLQNSSQANINHNSYAVILGIEDYLLESNVNYSQNSAKMFSKYANKILGVPKENIWSFIKDRETSSGFIKAQWIDFLSIIPKDSTIYFYYSGHGVPGNDGNAYILPSDTNAETIVLDKQFMLSNIYKNLNETKAKKIVAFVDSCFSGKDDNGNLLFGGVAPILRYNPLDINKSKMTLITAGGANEFSNQYKEKKHRLFSFYLMKGLAKGYTNSEDLFTYVKKNVLDQSRKIGYSYKQIPEISGIRNASIK